jgi:hypothetical protein
VLARVTIEHPDGWEFDWLDTPAPGSPDCLLHQCLYVFAQQGDDDTGVELDKLGNLATWLEMKPLEQDSRD